MIAIADLAERVGGDIRLTRQQNFIVTGIPNDELDEATAELEAIGFPLDINPVRGNSIACTGEPHCNFSVAETKTRLGRLIDRLEERFGTQIADLRLHLDGCPHACAQHWVGDLGFQGTTSRDEGGVRRQAYDIFVRGGARPRARDRPLALPARPDRRARRGGRGADRAAGSSGAQRRRELLGVHAPRERRGAGRARRARAGKGATTGGGGGVSTYRVDRRARGGRALDRVRGRGAAGGPRVGDRAVRAGPRDLDVVPDRQRRPDRHGLRDRPGRSRSSASTRAGCPSETLELADRLRDRYPGLQPRADPARRRRDRDDDRQARRRPLQDLRRPAPPLLQPPQGAAAHQAPPLARRLDHGPAPRPVGEPHEHPQGRDRPRPRRDREAEPARRVDRGRGLGLRARARRARTTRSTTRATSRSAARRARARSRPTSRAAPAAGGGRRTRPRSAASTARSRAAGSSTSCTRSSGDTAH